MSKIQTKVISADGKTSVFAVQQIMHHNLMEDGYIFLVQDEDMVIPFIVDASIDDPEMELFDYIYHGEDVAQTPYKEWRSKVRWIS